jgi:hypothetical protein
MRNKFINSRELLLIIINDENGIRAQETDYAHEIFETVADALAHTEDEYFFDEIERICRFDVETGKSEDVTDEIAHEYLGKHQTFSWEAHTLPDWVKNSGAWSDHCEVNGWAA